MKKIFTLTNILIALGIVLVITATSIYFMAKNILKGLIPNIVPGKTVISIINGTLNLATTITFPNTSKKNLTVVSVSGTMNRVSDNSVIGNFTTTLNGAILLPNQNTSLAIPMNIEGVSTIPDATVVPTPKYELNCDFKVKIGMFTYKVPVILYL